MKPKEKAPELKSSLSSIAAVLADNLNKEAKAGRIDILGEDQRWADQFRALCAWYKIEKGIDGDEEEGEGIRGFTSALGTGKPASRRKRATAPASDATEPEPTADGPASPEGLAELITQASAASSGGNVRDIRSAGNGIGRKDAAIFVAAGGKPSIRVGNGRPDNDEAGSGGDV